MPFEIHESMPWTEHFVQYGFAVLRNQVSREFIDAALERLRDHVEGEAKHLPFDEWTTHNTQVCARVPGDPVLDAIYDQPNIRRIIDTMFGTSEVGSPNGWSGKPEYRIFIRPFDPDYKPRPLRGGHIDFGGNIIPAFGDAFVIQVCLRDTEPHGGNITVIPGSHKLVQKMAIDNPYVQYPYDFADFPFTEPYEFVAKAGDVLLMQHLMFHEGNPCGGATRRPRLALHLQVQRSTFLTEADPANTHDSPWIKSFTLNGYHSDPNDQQRYQEFNANKKAMWGLWENDGLRYKIYTGSDGQLHAKITINGEEQVGANARFDGKHLNFDQWWGESHTRAHAVLTVEANDPERMRGTVTPDEGKPVAFELTRTEVFTTRLWNE